MSHFKRFLESEKSKNQSWKLEKELEEINTKISQKLSGKVESKKAAKIKYYIFKHIIIIKILYIILYYYNNNTLYHFCNEIIIKVMGTKGILNPYSKILFFYKNILFGEILAQYKI